MKSFCIAFALLLSISSAAQITTDTAKQFRLIPFTVSDSKVESDISRLQPVENTFIYSGKKSEVIELTKKDVALTEKYGRQVFSKIPGVFVYDMDGTGNQVNISTRGLDPHRGWEFNMRKDGVITNSDMYGYPAKRIRIELKGIQRLKIYSSPVSNA